MTSTPPDEALVERVARAIAAAEWSRNARLRRGETEHGDTAERYAERARGLWTDHALAALTAAQPVSNEQVTERIGRLLAADPICGGRVCQGTIDAIAALVAQPVSLGERKKG